MTARVALLACMLVLGLGACGRPLTTGRALSACRKELARWYGARHVRLRSNIAPSTSEWVMVGKLDDFDGGDQQWVCLPRGPGGNQVLVLPPRHGPIPSGVRPAKDCVEGLQARLRPLDLGSRCRSVLDLAFASQVGADFHNDVRFGDALLTSFSYCDDMPPLRRPRLPLCRDLRHYDRRDSSG